MSLLDSKSGQARNIILVPILLLVLALVSIFGMAIFLVFENAIIASGFYTQATQNAINGFKFALTLYDYIIVLIMVLLIIALGLTSFRLRTHPAFFIITFVSAIFTGVVSFFFNVIFIEIISETALAAALVFFPRTLIICTNLHWVTLVAIVVTSIALYGKRPQEETTQ